MNGAAGCRRGGAHAPPTQRGATGSGRGGEGAGGDRGERAYALCGPQGCARGVWASAQRRARRCRVGRRSLAAPTGRWDSAAVAPMQEHTKRRGAPRRQAGDTEPHWTRADKAGVGEHCPSARGRSKRGTKRAGERRKQEAKQKSILTLPFAPIASATSVCAPLGGSMPPLTANQISPRQRPQL